MRRSFFDWYLASALLVLGFVIGSTYIRAFLRAGGAADFGQLEFSAAVAQACGKGFVDPGYAATPGLWSFLNRRADAYSCSELPAALPPQHPNFTQGLYRYLMSTVALVWRVRGVSWWGLWPLFGIVYGATLAIAYGLFRLGMGRAIAVGATVMLAISAVHLGHIPFLRDYAKAPFILGLILLMARLAMGPMKRWRVLAYAVAFGAVLGLGFGFRNDLLISVPPFAAVVLFCLPGRVWENLQVKAAALALAALTFTIVAWPILTAYREGSNTGHVALLGLMIPFDRPLGIEGSIYDWGYTYRDGFAAATVNSYSARVHRTFVQYFSADYDRAMVEYVLQIARSWPADIVARAYASVLATLAMPFSVGVYNTGFPRGVTSEAMAHAYHWQQEILRLFMGRSALIVALALLVVGGQSVCAATALLLFLLYYAGYPAIQFDVRHFFHLEFISWWATGFLLQRACSVLSATVRTWGRRESRFNRPAFTAAVARAATFAAVAGVVIVGSLTTLRAYQTPHVRQLLRGYADAPLARLAMVTSSRGDQTRFNLPGLWTARDASHPLDTRYIVAEFSPASCRAAVLPVTFRYEARNDADDFSYTTWLELLPAAAPTRVFFAAYYNGTASHFVGVEVPRGFETCLTSISAVTDLARYPLLIGITLPPEWEHATLFQTLAGIEPSDRGTGDPHALHAIGETALITRTAFDGRFTNPDAVEYAAEIAHADGSGGWLVRGRPQFAASPLIRYAPRRVAKTDVLVAEGELRVGAVNIGLTAGGRWAQHVEIDSRGPFLIAIAPPDAGDFGVLVESHLADTWPANRIGRRLSPLVGWIPGATFRDDLTIRHIGWVPSK